MTILFRSKKAENTTQQGTRSKRGSLSDEWSDLRAYTSDDDSRDIVWKRSTDPNNTISKRREFQRSLRLIFCVDIDLGDDFSPSRQHFSRKKWKENSLENLEKSAKKSNFPFQKYTGKRDQNLENLAKQKIKNHLIIFLSSRLDSDMSRLKNLSRQNDVICIFVEHIFEKNPQENAWIEGKVFDTKKKDSYLRARSNLKKDLEKKHQKYQISTLFLDTTKSIEAPLNHFFKYRYARKK